ALPKIDWQINSANSFAITYNRLRWNSPAGIQTSPVVSRGLTSFGDDFVKVDWGTARLLSTINPRLINEFRVQVARDFEYENSQTPLAGEPRTALNGSSPDVFLTNGLEFGKATFLERLKYPDEKREQFVDNVTYSLGANTLKFGVDINHVHDTLFNLFTESGSYSYNNINDFIVDYVNFLTPLPANTLCFGSTATSIRTAGKCYTSPFQQGFGAPGAELSTNDYGAYIQYDWKFRPRLTLNLGVRYEYEQFPDPQIPSSSTAMIPNVGRTLAQATSFMPSDTNNFGPRIGFAFDLTGDGRTALRAGYGIYYGRAINSTIYNALIDTGNPAGQTLSTVTQTAATAPIFPNVLTSVPAGTASVQFFAKDFGNPLIQEVDLSIQRELGRNFTMSASYLGSFGRQLPTFYDRNLSQPTTTLAIPIVGGPFDGQTLTAPQFTGRPLAGFGPLTEITSRVHSEYNAFVVEANRRFAQSFQLQTSYTLSRATDDLQTSQTFTTNNVPVNVFDPGGNNGTTSNFDRRHKFVLAMVYEPRFKSDNKLATALLDGWSIAPIYKLFSGIAYDAGVSSGPTGGPAGSLNRSGGANRLFGLVDRNAFTGPTQNIFDLRLSRRFYIKEKANVEFLGEFFNLPNTVLTTNVNSTMYNFRPTSLVFNSAFGTTTQADSTLFRERQIQLGIRFHF
ncbi:MAG: TonB-dependent receptor, partial [Chloracidobacterium sp.]|nr:TonB-dependent receptor [Chloracidobacterium sp.]